MLQNIELRRTAVAALKWCVGLVVSLAIAYVADLFLNEEARRKALELQGTWVEALAAFSPAALLDGYVGHLQPMRANPGLADMFFQTIGAFFGFVRDLVSGPGNLVNILLLAIGTSASLWLFQMGWRRLAFYRHGLTLASLIPLHVMLAVGFGSAAGAALQWLSIAALNGLGSVISLAGISAGTFGAAGLFYVFGVKLIEKLVDTAVSAKLE